MRERTCAYCGKRIKGLWIEMTVNTLQEKQSSMKKVDLHPDCFDEVWGKCHRKESEHEDSQDG